MQEEIIHLEIELIRLIFKRLINNWEVAEIEEEIRILKIVELCLTGK
jgi:hypothetical protein